MCPSYIRKNLFTTLLLVLPLTVNAQESRLASLPDKVKINILKRHPTAIDLHAVGNEIHFSHYLLEVAYKVEGNDTEVLDLFSEDGKLFANELTVENLNDAPHLVKETLENNVPGYKIIKAELVGNPNGLGEEYELYLLVGDEIMKVSINQKGNIVQSGHS